MTNSIKLESSWLEKLEEEFEKDYMKDLRGFLKAELEKGKTIYPHGTDIFQAFDKSPFDKTKVVIIGQDPYHGEGQAHGMCFSVKKGVKTPPSLINIYKELHDDLGCTIPNHGYLEKWADQGVLLLNNVLTVEKAKAASHQGKGWETFTDKVIDIINKEKENCVFILWGSPAQRKGSKIDTSKHLIIKSPHPSPLAAYRGFFGSKPFSKTNDYLKEKNLETIDWSIT